MKRIYSLLIAILLCSSLCFSAALAQEEAQTLDVDSFVGAFEERWSATNEALYEFTVYPRESAEDTGVYAVGTVDGTIQLMIAREDSQIAVPSDQTLLYRDTRLGLPVFLCGTTKDTLTEQDCVRIIETFLAIHHTLNPDAPPEEDFLVFQQIQVLGESLWDAVLDKYFPENRSTLGFEISPIVLTPGGKVIWQIRP